MNWLEALNTTVGTVADAYGSVRGNQREQTTAQQAVQQQTDLARAETSRWKSFAVIGAIVAVVIGAVLLFRK